MLGVGKLQTRAVRQPVQAKEVQFANDAAIDFRQSYVAGVFDEQVVKAQVEIVIAGDLVAISAAGVTVNGQPVQGTAQLPRDGAGRPLRPFPAGIYRVVAGELWLLSGHDPRSFDSRYFGPVPTKNVQGVARPIWVLR